jgi:hypothetical protein
MAPGPRVPSGNDRSEGFKESISGEVGRRELTDVKSSARPWSSFPPCDNFAHRPLLATFRLIASGLLGMVAARTYDLKQSRRDAARAR